MSDAQTLCEQLRQTRGFAHKRDISDVVSVLAQAMPAMAMNQAVPVGDDTAAIPDGHGGYVLFAIEGLAEEFIESMPWLAGFSAVMVNNSDIYAIGRRPPAVLNAWWSAGMNPASEMHPGITAASQQ